MDFSCWLLDPQLLHCGVAHTAVAFEDCNVDTAAETGEKLATLEFCISVLATKWVASCRTVDQALSLIATTEKSLAPEGCAQTEHKGLHIGFVSIQTFIQYQNCFLLQFVHSLDNNQPRESPVCAKGILNLEVVD